jgi:hypothetical protein
MEWSDRTFALIVLRVCLELARSGARLLTQQQGIMAFSLTQTFPAARPGARVRSAFGRSGRCGMPACRLSSRRGTVRPNKSFKPTPLRGAA